jgi:epoxyqueuosine reductase QueG
MITDADLEHNAKEEPNLCKNCDKCQKACPLAALDHPYILNLKKCMSYLLQSKNLPEEVKTVMENRVGDCEICQESCPWNRKHLENPLVTKMTEYFRRKTEDWENFFYLPDLIELSEKRYTEKLGHLNTDIPFRIFHRNVTMALEKAKKTEESANPYGGGTI